MNIPVPCLSSYVLNQLLDENSTAIFSELEEFKSSELGIDKMNSS